MLERLEIFHGELTPSVGHLYVRLQRDPEGRSLRLAGRIRGPLSRFGATLPAVAPLRELPQGETLLARGIVTDPCGWNPDFPARYLVEIELHDERGPIERTTREFTFLRFGPAGDRFLSEGKRWVLRGVTADEITVSDETWRSTGTCAVLNRESESFREATAAGIWVASRNGVHESAPIRIAAHAELSAFAARNIATNQTWIQEVHSAEEEFHPLAGALLVRVEQLAAVRERLGEVRLPLIAYRPDSFGSLEAGREACDRLQAELAPLGQFAGYVV